MPVSKGACVKKQKQQSTSGGERYVSLLLFLQLCFLVYSVTAVLVLLLLDQDDGPSPARGRSAGARRRTAGRRRSSPASRRMAGRRRLSPARGRSAGARRTSAGRRRSSPPRTRTAGCIKVKINLVITILFGLIESLKVVATSLPRHCGSSPRKQCPCRCSSRRCRRRCRQRRRGRECHRDDARLSLRRRGARGVHGRHPGPCRPPLPRIRRTASATLRCGAGY